MAVEGGFPLQSSALSLPEMPISGDLKSGDSLFFTTPGISTDSPTPTN